MRNYLEYCAINVPFLRFSTSKLGLPVPIGDKDKKTMLLNTGIAPQTIVRTSTRLKRNEQFPEQPDMIAKLEDFELCVSDKKCIVTNNSSNM